MIPPHRHDMTRLNMMLVLLISSLLIGGCEAVEGDEGLALAVPDASQFGAIPDRPDDLPDATSGASMDEDIRPRDELVESPPADAGGDEVDSPQDPVDGAEVEAPESEPAPPPEERETSFCGDGVCDADEGCALCVVDCPVCHPEPMEIVITEIMRNPLAVADSEGEWIELYNAADEVRDLSGLMLRDDGDDAHALSPDAPLLIEPGGYVLIGASPTLGAVAEADEVWDGFYVGNGTDAVILMHGDVIIDMVSFNGDVAWPATAGASMSLDPEAYGALDNDDPLNWCSAVIALDNGDYGTPGQPNWPCSAAAPSVCGDGVCAGDESCEVCLDDCGACPCPEGTIEGCDGGCVSTALLGDGVCDTSLDCPLYLFDGGDCLGQGCGTHLIISEYVEGAGNNKAVELYNPTGFEADLTRYTLWKLSNGGIWPDDATARPLEGTLAPHETFVFCHSKLMESFDGVCHMQSGGNPMNFNGNDALFLTFDGLLVDQLGEAGEAPTGGWYVSGVEQATKDHTLRRASHVTMGSSDWGSASSSEWTVVDQDALDDLGTHTVNQVCAP